MHVFLVDRGAGIRVGAEETPDVLKKKENIYSAKYTKYNVKNNYLIIISMPYYQATYRLLQSIC